MKKYDIVIGIDPDSVESGVGVVYPDSRNVTPMKFSFAKLIDYLRLTKDLGKTFCVVVEGGWLNKSNWHTLGIRRGAQVAAEIGRRTGMNHQTGILIEQMCDAMQIPCTVVKPLRKMWKGADGKITHTELQNIVGITCKLPRTNQDERDACLLAWVHAGLPIRLTQGSIKPKAYGQ